MYLRGFSEVKESGKALIWQFNLKTMQQTPVQVDVQDICFEKNLYEIKGRDGSFIAQNTIEKTFGRMQALERQFPGQPVIVHSDLMLVDEALHTLDTSFIRNQQIKLEAIKTFEDYAATNTMTGCTMLFNNQTKQCTKRPYEKAIMHDAWICLSIVSQQGIVDFIDESLIKYRQHSNNTLGAQDMSKQTLGHKLKHIRRQISDNIRHYQEMNAVKRLSAIDFLKAKLRYKRY